MKEPTVAILIRVPKSVDAWARAQADREKRPLSDFLRLIIEDAKKKDEHEN